MSIEENSKRLKNIIGTFEVDGFMSQMALLLTYLDKGPIPYKPFHELHSPLRQIFYLTALNLSSNNEKRVEYNLKANSALYKEWEIIIKILQELDIEYEQVFVNQEKLDNTFETEKIRVVYPSFIDYFYSGPLNFEEQVIERIERYFSNQHEQIESELGLKVSDFINIYNILDEEMHQQLNRPKILLEIKECKKFWEEMRESKIRPNNWKLTDNENVNELIAIFQDESNRLKITPSNLYGQYDNIKVDRFFDLLLCNNKIDFSFSLFTEENFLIKHPLFRLNDGRVLVFDLKQVLHSIYDLLYNFSIRNEQSAQIFYKKRGVELEVKIEEVLKRFCGPNALVFRDYKTKLGKGQDLLVYCKGLLLVIEAKSSKKDMPTLNVNAAFNQVKSNFKEIFQKGFEQTNRVEELFYTEDYLDIFDKKGKFLFKIRNKNVHHIFSIIVTLEKFSEIQTDLSLMLKVEDGTSFPYSICIDDLEAFLITMKREKCSLQDFIHYLEQRVKFYGRLECKDELEMCGQFLKRKKLEVPPGSDIVVVVGSDGDDIFEKYYEKGLGFSNEKKIDRKQSGHFIKWPNSGQIMKFS